MAWRRAKITLQENDGTVTGDYPAYGGKIEGEVHDREPTGHWIEGPRSGGIYFVLASDGRAFMGRFDNGEWWTGRRIAVSSREFVDQSGVREALRTFVVAGDAARRGSFDELAAAAAVLDFGEAGAGMVPGKNWLRRVSCSISSISRHFIFRRFPANARRATISTSSLLRPAPARSCRCRWRKRTPGGSLSIRARTY